MSSILWQRRAALELELHRTQKDKMTSKPKPQSERQPLWETVRAQSVSSQIVERVRDGLFRGELKPGDLIGSESDLALKLGVSRVPVL
jgi:hypothetical protein